LTAAQQKMQEHYHGLEKVLGERISTLVYDTLVVHNKDKNVDKSIALLTDVTTTRNVSQDHRSRVIQSLRKLQTNGGGGGGGKNKALKGIEDVFVPILKVINVSSVLECSTQSLGVVMNVCMELAADDAYEKTMSTLQLINTLSNKLSPSYGHYCYRSLMALIVMMMEGDHQHKEDLEEEEDEEEDEDEADEEEEAEEEEEDDDEAAEEESAEKDAERDAEEENEEAAPFTAPFNTRSNSLSTMF
jgi:hypothetical protein